jgi:large subunit ribosomal protein L5
MLLMNCYYKLVLKYDLLNKFTYKNIEEVPKLKKISLNFKYDNKSFNMKSLALTMLALELIAKQKGKLTSLKNTKISIKIRKGYPVGCKVTLRKTIMTEFFFKLLINVFPKIKNFYGVRIKKSQINTISFKLANSSSFDELERHHNLFKNLPLLDITFVTTTKNQKELLYLVISHKLPLLY